MLGEVWSPPPLYPPASSAAPASHEGAVGIAGEGGGLGAGRSGWVWLWPPSRWIGRGLILRPSCASFSSAFHSICLSSHTFGWVCGSGFRLDWESLHRGGLR